MNKPPDFLQIFPVKKPVIGMLHLEALPGEPGFTSIDSVVTAAKRDINALQEGGIHGIEVENWREDSVGQFIAAETADGFDTVLEKIVGDFSVPFGINVLNNDYKTMYTLAAKYHASFVQLDVFVDHVRSDFSYGTLATTHPFEIRPDTDSVMAFAIEAQADNIPLIVFIHPKHYLLLEKNKSLSQSASQAHTSGASAVIVTKKTGVAPTLDVVTEAKKGNNTIPVGVGSGVDESTINDFLSVADFCIVGTALKKDGVTNNPVDADRVARLVRSIPL